MKSPQTAPVNLNGNGPSHRRAEDTFADIASSGVGRTHAPALSIPAAMLQPALAVTDSAPETRFRFYSRAEWQAMPPKEWLVERVFGPGDLGMLHAASGAGKTFVALDLAAHCVLGIDWAAGRFAVARPMRVLYCAGEGMTGVPQRLEALEESLGASLDALYVAEIPQLLEMGSLDGVFTYWHEWEAWCAAKGTDTALDLIILDTLHSASYGAEENSAQDAGKLLNSMKRLGKMAGGAAVLTVHHTNAAGTRERGSSALRGAMDVMLSVAGDGVVKMLRCDKLKDGEQWQDVGFSLAAQETSAVVAWLDGASTAAAVRGKEGGDKAALLAYLEAAAGREISAADLAKLIGKTPTHTRNLLAHLDRDGAIVTRNDTDHKPRARLLYSVFPNGT